MPSLFRAGLFSGFAIGLPTLILKSKKEMIYDSLITLLSGSLVGFQPHLPAPNIWYLTSPFQDSISSSVIVPFWSCKMYFCNFYKNMLDQRP